MILDTLVHLFALAPSMLCRVKLKTDGGDGVVTLRRYASRPSAMFRKALLESLEKVVDAESEKATVPAVSVHRRPDFCER